MPTIFVHRHRVLDSEIDDLGHANNGAYISWMQDAAIAHSTAQGWSTTQYRAHSFAWVARSHKIEYLQSALAGDTILVHTWVADMQKVSSLRRYEIRRESDDALLATAETRWVFIATQTGKPARIPSEVQSKFDVVPDG